MKQLKSNVQDIDLRPAEIGKIKIGASGKNSNGGKTAVKMDRFWIATKEKGEDGNFIADTALMNEIKKENGQDINEPIKRIRVTLPFNEPSLNQTSRYYQRLNGVVTGVGDGETFFSINPKTGEKTEIERPHEKLSPNYQGNDKWKLSSTLSVIINCAKKIGGVWKFRTTGFYSHTNVAGFMEQMRAKTGGQLAGIPLDMVIEAGVGKTNTGASTKIYSIRLEFVGSETDLLEKINLIPNFNSKKVEEIENRLLGMQVEPIDLFDSEEDDHIFDSEPDEKQKPLKTQDQKKVKVDPVLITEKTNETETIEESFEDDVLNLEDEELDGLFD
jgi:hypothetical protein